MQSDNVFELNARHLRAILAVAENRSFIAAAASLRISQPALTRTIQQVETTLGLELFSRTTRQVSVTQAGKEVAALAERVLNDLSISIGNVQRQAAQPSGSIAVASVLSLASALLPGLLADFGRRYPGIQIHLREGIQRDVVDDVRSGQVDFGIGYVEGLPETFAIEDLGIERFHVVLPASHSLARQKMIDIASLKEETMVSFPRESRSRQIADGAAAAAGFTLRYAMTVNRLPTLLELVRNRVGLTILPASECPTASDRRLVWRPLRGSRVSCRLGVMRARERELTPAAAILLVVVRQWLREVAAARPVRTQRVEKSRRRLAAQRR